MENREEYEKVVRLLEERGVTNAGEVVHPDEDFEPILGSIAIWDKKADGTPNLLVWMIRNGEGRGYKPAHERTAVHSGEAPAPRGMSAEEWYRRLRGISYRPGRHPDRLMADQHEVSDEEVWELAQRKAAS